MHIYRLIPRKEHFYVVCGCERYEKLPKSDQNLSVIKNGKSSKEIKLAGYQSIDTKHFSVDIKFEVVLSTLFTKK
jgi:hypothetical protein